ncbi:MAG: HEAT repeat domain-containing protein, partial [Bacteroidota bacterium]
MKTIHGNQRIVASALLSSLLLQGCGLHQPIELQPRQAAAPLQHADATQQSAQQLLYPDALRTDTPSTSHLLEDADFVPSQKVDQQHPCPHLTSQAYCTGERLARQFLSGEQKAVTEFLKQYMYTPCYRGTLSFMSGEIVKGMSSEVSSAASSGELVPIQALLQLLDKLPEEVLGFQYLMLQLRLLNEWLLVAADSEEKTETLAALEAKFHLGQNLIMWFNESLHQYKQQGDKSTQVLYTTLITLLSEASGVTRHYGTELQESIRNAIKGSDADVCRAALQALPILNALEDEYSDLVKNSSADVQKMVTPVLNMIKGNDSGLRIVGLNTLKSLVEKSLCREGSNRWGTDVQEILVVVFRTLKDSDYRVRSAATEFLPTLVEKKGADVQEMLTPTLNALEDSDSNVRTGAIQALRALVEKGADVQEMSAPILNALEDSNSFVRMTALQILRILAEKGGAVQEMLTPTLNVLKDRNSFMRIAALQALPT